MWQRVWQKLETTVAGGAVLVSSSWIISKVLGLLRERLIAERFGASVQTDAYYAAFSVPDFVYGTLILGSLLTAFIPVFVAARQRDEAEAWRITNTIMNAMALIMAALALIIILGAPLFVHLIAPGFHGERFSLTVTLTRLLAVNLIFFAMSNVLSGVLNSVKKFAVYSLAPIVYNASIIGGVVFLAPQYGIQGVAVGAVVGAALHFAIQIPAARKAGFRYRAVLDWSNAGVRQIGRLIIPRAIGQSITQIDQIVNVVIASTLALGSVTIFRWANNIQDLPVTLIGVSLATVAFPVFAETLARGDKEGFTIQFSRIVRQILFLVIPISILILQLRAQLVRVIIGAHGVTWPQTITTSQTLAFFTISLFAQALIPVLARSFYAMQDTRTPVRITAVALGLDIVGSFVLSHFMGVTGLALSYSISSLIAALALFVALRKRVGHLDDERIVRTVFRVIGITILMSIVVQGTKFVLVSLGLDLTRAVGVFAQAFVAGSVGALAYLAFALLFRFEEISLLALGLTRIRDRITRSRGPSDS